MELFQYFVLYLLLIEVVLLTTDAAPRFKGRKHGRRHRSNSYGDVRPGPDMAEKMRQAINLLRLEAKAEREMKAASFDNTPNDNCCLNGGTCIMGNFCECPKGFYGQYCQYYDYEGSSPCGNVSHGEVVYKGCTRCSCHDGILTCNPQARCADEAEGSKIWTISYKRPGRRNKQNNAMFLNQLKVKDEDIGNSGISIKSSFTFVAGLFVILSILIL